MPKAVDRWDAFAGHEPSTSTKILPSLTSYFARSSASASELTLMAACGWRALMARMASPLSGMATSDHSCSGDAPLGFGSTVTIFHPVVMHLRLTSSLVPAHPTTSTRRPNQFTAVSLLGRVPRDHRARPWRRPRQDRSATKTGIRLLVFRVRHSALAFGRISTSSSDVFLSKECDFGYDCVFARDKMGFIGKPDHIGARCFESGWDHFACTTLACSAHAHHSQKLNLKYVFVMMIPHHSRPH